VQRDIGARAKGLIGRLRAVRSPRRLGREIIATLHELRGEVDRVLGL
jgi:hypothetical protein